VYSGGARASLHCGTAIESAGRHREAHCEDDLRALRHAPADVVSPLASAAKLIKAHMPNQFVPAGHNCVSPYVHATDVPRLIAFLKETLGAEEVLRLAMPDGQVVHAEVKVGDSTIMMGSPPEERRMRSQIHCYVENVDAAYARALAAGATSVRVPEDMFYGDRSAGVEDAWGNEWFLATHKEEVSPAEMQRRIAKMK
jgi:PhnB protein